MLIFVMWVILIVNALFAMLLFAEGLKAWDDDDTLSSLCMIFWSFVLAFGVVEGSRWLLPW